MHGRPTSSPLVTAASPAMQAWRGVKPSPGLLLFTPGHPQGLPVVSLGERELSRHPLETRSTSPRAADSQIVDAAEWISFVLLQDNKSKARCAWNWSTVMGRVSAEPSETRALAVQLVFIVPLDKDILSQHQFRW